MSPDWNEGQNRKPIMKAPIPEELLELNHYEMIYLRAIVDGMFEKPVQDMNKGMAYEYGKVCGAMAEISDLRRMELRRMAIRFLEEEQ